MCWSRQLRRVITTRVRTRSSYHGNHIASIRIILIYPRTRPSTPIGRIGSPCAYDMCIYWCRSNPFFDFFFTVFLRRPYTWPAVRRCIRRCTLIGARSVHNTRRYGIFVCFLQPRRSSGITISPELVTKGRWIPISLLLWASAGVRFEINYDELWLKIMFQRKSCRNVQRPNARIGNTIGAEPDVRKLWSSMVTGTRESDKKFNGRRCFPRRLYILFVVLKI